MRKICCILLLSLFIVIVGCGQKSLEPEGNTESSVENNEGTNGGPNKEPEKIQVYFSDTQVEKLEQAEYEISFSNNNEKYQKVYEALQDNSDPEKISLWNRMELISATFHEGVVTLNIHIPDDARLGSGGEQLALEILEKTLFQFDEVQSIDLLVDGNPVDSLMGHIDLEHPIQRDKL